MKTKTALLMTSLFLATTGMLSCRNSQKAKFNAWGDDFKVEILGCNGQTVRQYLSDGKPASETDSDGYYFKDKVTGNLVEVSGNVIITECDECRVEDFKQQPVLKP